MDGASSVAAQFVPSPKPVSVAVDPVALVVTECITVTSAMRKHARWAHSSVSAILGGAVSSPRLEVPRNPAAGRLAPDKKKPPGTPLPVSDGDDLSLASRWGLRGKKGQSMQDNPLLSAFAKLRSDLKRCKDIYSIEAPALLHPFLQVIRSSSTSAPITSLALIAINKFFAYDIIGNKSPQLPLAMQMLSSAVTHCRFEATESATDEVVLFRILKLMEGMITGPGGEVLGDESMCEMMETGISMCCQVRLSELLRRAAEVSMVTMCQTIFQKLKQMEVTAEETPMRRSSSNKIEEDALKMDPAINGNLLGSQTPVETSRSSRSFEQSRSRSSQSIDHLREDVVGNESTTGDPDAVNGGSQVDLSQQAEVELPIEIKPYGLASIRELFRVLVGLIDPHDRQHNDTMRVMALRIVDVALEVAGPSIASHPSLATLAKDTLCRHLFQLVRSENIVILNESLRVAGTLLSTCRRVLKLQQELFLSYLVACLHPRVEIPQEPGLDPSLYDGVPQAPRLVKPVPSQSSSGRSTPVPVKDRQKLGLEGGSRKPDAREAMVESVGGLVRIPSFMAELFVNYDCEIDRADLCVDMVGLLCRNAFPDAATWSTTNVPPLCLDALLGYIQSIADRLKDDTTQESFPSVDQLRQQRKMKSIIIQGTTKFNDKPQAGIAFLASQGIIEDPNDPRSVSRFLKGTSRIDKRVLGDYISKRSNEALLSAFMDSFDFRELRVDEALRQVLNSFRLPGEAPLIERIVSEFASKYFSTVSHDDIADKDALYVLTYAIIMLNTDQHNPNVKSQNRMQFQDFARNLRGVNGGKDFESDYLEEIYESIRTREIILPEEHDNKLSFDHAWKELLFKIQSGGDLLICDTNLFDPDMFAATWKPIIATLSYVFMSATDDTVFSRVVAGFDQCAQIAAKYKIHDALDHIIFCLSSISTLAAHSLPSTTLNTEVQAGDKSIMVSETAVRFGRDFKAQLATVVLFRVVKGNEAAIRDGWKHIVKIMLNLFVNSLITAPYASISSNTDLPPIPLQSPTQLLDRSDRSQEGGLFSVFTSYVTSFANDEPPEPSDKEIEDTLCAIDCIDACAFQTLFSNINQMPSESLSIFLDVLLSQIPDEGDPRVIVVKSELPTPTPVRPNDQKSKTVGVAYDASVVFVLELATTLATRDADAMRTLGVDVADALQSIVRDASHVHPVTLSRTIYYLLSFLKASHDNDFIRVPLLLHTISKLDHEMLKQSALSVVKGLNLCLRGAAGLRNEMVNSPDFWSVLQTLQTMPETAAEVFELLESVAGGSASALTTDNYEPVISLLSNFATAGSVGAAEEQRRDIAARRGGPRKLNPGPPVIRGLKAVQIVYEVAARVPQFIHQSQLEPQEAWTTYWTPLFRTLTTHSLNPCRQIRSQSLSSLQRILLSPSLGIDGSNITSSPVAAFIRTAMLFTDVIFPLIMQLLKPEVFQSDPAGMGETRLQAAVLACKVFVRYLDTLLDPSIAPPPNTVATGLMSPVAEKTLASTLPSVDETTTRDDPSVQQQQQVQQQAQPQQPQAPQWDGIRLWSRILQMMERLIKSSSVAQGDGFGLDEAIGESLKNIVLVMASAGHLVPPTPPAAPTPGVAPVAAGTSTEQNGEQELQDQQQQQQQQQQVADSSEGGHATGPVSTSENPTEPFDSRTHQQTRLWHVTQVRLERFLPELLEGIYPGSIRRTAVPAAASVMSPVTPSTPRQSAVERTMPRRDRPDSAKEKAPTAEERGSADRQTEGQMRNTQTGETLVQSTEVTG